MPEKIPEFLMDGNKFYRLSDSGKIGKIIYAHYEYKDGNWWRTLDVYTVQDNNLVIGNITVSNSPMERNCVNARRIPYSKRLEALVLFEAALKIKEDHKLRKVVEMLKDCLRKV